MISARDRFIYFKLLHCAYYTPHQLATIYPHMLDLCRRCGAEPGILIHVLWTCPHLKTYWREVSSVISIVGGLPLLVDPLIFILGVVDKRLPAVHNGLLFTPPSMLEGTFYKDGG